eukprot:944641-Prymnesium_polylepis.1
MDRFAVLQENGGTLTTSGGNARWERDRRRNRSGNTGADRHGGPRREHWDVDEDRAKSVLCT